MSRRMFALVVALLVAMMGLSDLAIYLIHPTPPTAVQVRAQIQSELDQRAATVDRRTCAILASLHRTKRSDRVRRQLHCYRALHPQPTATATSTIVMPGAHTTTVTTRTISPSPSKTSHHHSVHPEPTCTSVQVLTRCQPVPTPTLHLR